MIDEKRVRVWNALAEPWRMGALIVVVCAAAVQAQRPAPIAVQIKIEISGQCSHEDKISVVINGDESTPQALFPESRIAGQSIWIFPWSDERSPAFPKAALSASLRFKDSRTYCRRAKEERSRKGDLVASFWFSCERQQVQEVSILAEQTGHSPAVPFSYVRTVGKNPVLRKDGLDCDCLETGAFAGAGLVPATWFPTEELRLQIGWDLPHQKAPGLYVNDPAVIEHAEQGGHRRLDREDVVCALAAQRLEGKQGSRPDLSTQAMDVDDKSLRDIHLKSVDLKVTK